MTKKRKEIEKIYEKGREALDENRLEEAVKFYMEATQGFDELGEYVLSVRCQNLMGISYAALSNESMAVDCYLNGLDYVKKHGIRGGKNLFYNNIGTRYQELGDDEKALEYFNLSQKDLEENGDYFPGASPSWEVVGYLNIGVSQFHLNHLEEAKWNLLKAQEVARQNEYQHFKFSIICVLSRVYLAMGAQEYAREHLDEMMAHAMRVEATVNDYTQDILEFTSLLKELKVYDMWKECLVNYDKLAIEQKNATVSLQAVEFWINYYETLGLDEQYREMCVQYMRLYSEHKKASDKEKIMALNAKIELKNARDFLKDAEEKSEKDALTGLGNRYAMHKYGDEIIKTSFREQTLLAVGILDIDCFKTLNDSYGHLKGDDALKQLADILFNCLDGYGSVYRFGGDEFVLVILNATKGIVDKISKKIMDMVEEAHIPNIKSPVNTELTVSLGIVYDIPHKESKIDDFVDRADTVLYQVKKRGRNSYKVNE